MGGLMRQGTGSFRRFSADYVHGATRARYRYEVTFSLGDEIHWQADVFLDDELKGHRQGQFDRKGMVEADIVGVIKALVDEDIEGLNGITQ